MDEVIEGTVGDLALKQIRTDIIFGALAPDQRLVLDRLKKTYRVSVGTLREILSRLTAEDLVVAEGNKGFRVAPISERGLREAADLRLLLESHALAASFEQGDLDWEGRVVAAHHKLATMESALLEGKSADPQLWKRFDWEFHQALISACGSQTLMAAHARSFDKYLRYQNLAMSFRGAVAIEEHAKLEAAAMARDVARARDILARHIAGGVENALQHRVFA